MKRTITLITLAGASVFVQAQQKVIEVDSAPAKAFYATQEWENAFVGYYGVNSGIEPGIPENEREREVLAQVKNFLTTGTDADLMQAAAAVDALIREQQGQGENTSPLMLQIAGTLQMRAAELAKDPAAATRANKTAETYLKRAVDPNTGFPNFLRAHKNLANLLFRNLRHPGSHLHGGR